MNKSERALVRKMVGPLSLYKRVADLEQEIQESRRLNQRLCDVLDVVVEILVPVADRDDDRMRAALARLDSVLKAPGPDEETES